MAEDKTIQELLSEPDNMEHIKIARNAIRLTFSKSWMNLNEKLQTVSLSENEKTVLLGILEEKFDQLEELNKTIFNGMIKAKMSESEIALEINEVDEYKIKFSHVKLEADKSFPVQSSTKSIDERRKLLLPKIEIKKFNGDVREWLQFWSQFKKIHEDESIDKEDKFQYLIQVMETGSRPSELVGSYPSTAENYDKVVLALQSRFGREELLVEVYFRELLELVLKRVTKSSKNIPFPKIYSKLESQVNALQSLGVTSDKCATILYTLVELLLPEDMFRSWQKNCQTFNLKAGGNQLSGLMEFLQSRIENEERIFQVRKNLYASVEELINKRNRFARRKRNLSKEDREPSSGIISCLLYSFHKVFKTLMRKI